MYAWKLVVLAAVMVMVGHVIAKHDTAPGGAASSRMEVCDQISLLQVPGEMHVVPGRGRDTKISNNPDNIFDDAVIDKGGTAAHDLADMEKSGGISLFQMVAFHTSDELEGAKRTVNDQGLLVATPASHWRTSLAVMASRFDGRAAENAQNLSSALDIDGVIDNLINIDMNGRLCLMCGEPLPERIDKNYTQRTDCGNHSLVDHPEVLERPLVDFNRPATGGQSATNAWCELNVQKVCADSLYNRDFLYQAKTVDLPREMNFPYDFWYCKYNGFLEPEIKALQNDFDGMQAKAAQFCEERTGWRNITLKQVADAYQPGFERGGPTEEEARFLGSWLCAMGSAGCDMAYCAYTYCDKGGGAYGVYEECEGWDPVKGM